MHQFIIDGFIRIYAKDLYAIRPASSLSSKLGVNGSRTSLLESSAQANKKKKTKDDSSKLPVPAVISPRTFTRHNLFKDGKFKCLCGKGCKANFKGYIERHIST